MICSFLNSVTRTVFTFAIDHSLELEKESNELIFFYSRLNMRWRDVCLGNLSNLDMDCLLLYVNHNAGRSHCFTLFSIQFNENIYITMRFSLGIFVVCVVVMSNEIFKKKRVWSHFCIWLPPANRWSHCVIHGAPWLKNERY